MRNTFKIYTILTLLHFSFLGCSTTVTKKTPLNVSDVSSVIENPTPGQEVTLQGKIIGKIEKCHIFTDGTNKILIHFKDEKLNKELAYDPDTMVEISGMVERGVMPGMHHFEGGHHGNIPMDTMIMVHQFQTISTN